MNDQESSTLSKSKFNAEVTKTAKLVARGWEYLAGDRSGDTEALMNELYNAPTVFIHNRKKPDSNRPTGSKDKKYEAKDADIIADIRGGVKRPGAIRARYPIRVQYRSHAKRIKRKMDEQDAETRRIIALQTPDESGH
jgi:hypothetical protein